jgi:hypothetical protein
VFPEEHFDKVQETLIAPHGSSEYKRVIMSLKDIVSGPFFSEYIKKGVVPVMFKMVDYELLFLMLVYRGCRNALGRADWCRQRHLFAKWYVVWYGPVTQAPSLTDQAN